VALAVPSVAIGWLTIEPMLFGTFFGSAIFVGEHNPLAEVGEEFHGSAAFILHAFQTPAIYLAAAGALTAWFLWLKRPDLPGRIKETLAPLHTLLENKYYFDWFNENVLARATRGLGTGLWAAGDRFLIDGVLVNGSAKTVAALSTVVRRVQSGYLYHYAFAMVIGLAALVGWFVVRS
jgi:NADH-quinone oxidoreductase subunit L